MKQTQGRQTVPKSQLIQLYRQAVANGLPLSTVDSKVQVFIDRFQLTVAVEEQDDKKRIKKLQKSVPFRTRLISHAIPILCVSVGLFLLSSAIWPILSYFVFSALGTGDLQAPVPQAMIIDSQRFQQNIQAQAATIPEADSGQEENQDPVILSEELDYTNLTNWFPSLSFSEQELLAGSSKTESIEYTIDIPAVNVEQARVRIGGTNLDHSLIQYPGTANPGEPGSPVIFGHSVLRQFYNPAIKNPRRYMSIFSKIMTLKAGDKIYVTRDNVKYSYTVRDKTEVKPQDVYILEQNYTGRELKLITCVPEGTYLRRGVIRATLDE